MKSDHTRKPVFQLLNVLLLAIKYHQKLGKQMLFHLQLLLLIFHQFLDQDSLLCTKTGLAFIPFL
jgi:hypothetical protein